MMNTPICDFVRNYAAHKTSRLHMPGHKGTPYLGPESLDITEIVGADVLYSAEGVIRESEKNAATLFCSARTLYSAEGSSLCIRAMLYLAMTYARSRGKRPVIAAGRNAHKTFLYAAALLDLDVLWLYPEKTETLLSCEITVGALEKVFTEAEEPPAAVYITSPDYLGNMSDLAALGRVCKKYGALFLVDNAHGAYLRFLSPSRHPIDLGADICCDSAHKTLPVLTGGAYLHFSSRIPATLLNLAENAMSIFASTSPSYLILQSLDLANHLLSGDYSAKLKKTAEQVFILKEKMRSLGFGLIGDEPLKLTVSAKSYGYSGQALAEILSEAGIICEFSDPDFVVLMFSAESEKSDFARLEKCFLEIKRRPAIEFYPPCISCPEQAMSLREALFSLSEKVLCAESFGRVLAFSDVSCPPAVPIGVCGERISREMQRCFEYYGIKNCFVVAE